jgi:Amt family ammonium transporter
MPDFGDGWHTPVGHRIFYVAARILGPAIDPEPEQVLIEQSIDRAKMMHLNLPANSDCPEQREILDALPVLVFLERAGQIVFANAEARQMLGHGESEWVSRPIEEVLWGLFPGTAEPQTLLTGTRRGSPFHATLPAKNGRLLPVEGMYSITNAELHESVIVAHPGGRERAPKTRLMEDVLASIPEAVAIEHGNHVLYTNPAFTRMFGYSAEEAGGGSLGELIVPETRLHEHATLAKGVNEQGRVMVETVRRNKAGELVDVNLQVAPLLVDGAPVGYVFTFRGMGACKEAEEKLQHDATHDVLTGLPNRTMFLDRVKLALKRRARRPAHTCGIICLDMDGFKAVNDALGHAAGDVLLNSVAERLRGSLRPQDTAARLGGDSFAVLVEDVASIGDVESIAGRIALELTRPFDVYGHLIESRASVGVAIAGPEHAAPDPLIHEADLAMFSCKQAGGGGYQIFGKHLEAHSHAQIPPAGVA